jgi:anti-anti-sigma factor
LTAPPTTFEVRESRTGDICRLTVFGELDLASASVLEDRLARLRALNLPVSLDLSKVDFMDSTGIHLLVRAVGEARLRHWDLRIESDIPPQLMSVLRLLQLDRFLLSGADVPLPGRGRSHPTSFEAPSATSPLY